MSPQDMLLQKQQLRLNTRKLMQQRKALSKQKPISQPMNPASLEPVKEAIQEKAERVNVLGKYYTVSLVFRGVGKIVQFFVPDIKRPTRDEFQANVEKIYPGGRLVHYYESDRQPQQPTLFIQKEEVAPTIDKKAHRSAQRDAKIGNLARKTDNPGEKAAAERKAKGPKLMGERALSSDEKDDKEKYVKGMKKSVKDFKKRYGDEYKSVMYATATKMAKEETEEVDECWKTHKKVGMKMKGGKLVPDCRPKNEEVEHVEEDWQKKSGKNPEGGLNEKGRKSYERENPGSDLKRPSKKVGNKRRASFCARMKGMKKKLTSSKTANDPDSRINKSLRAWNC